MKKDKRNGQKIRYRLYVSAFIMAAGVFAVMTYLQREALSEFDKKEICVASAVIPRGTVLDSGNLSQYVTVKSIDAGCVPDLALTDPDTLLGMSPAYDITALTPLTGGMFSSPSPVMREMKSPVLAGFKTDDLSRAVSGILRAGDRIDVYSSNPKTGEGSLLCANVYVERGYDASGNATEDAEAAVMFNVYLDSVQAESFYEGLNNGSLYVVKRC